ncbi:MAG: HAD family hydrolase [Dehalococcoidia bacterium]|nr:HAD family hydrolase [Dehalococcoidia bacterium]
MPADAPYRVSLIVFDVDGTLIDFVGAFGAAARGAAAHLSRLVGREVTAAELLGARDLVTLDPSTAGLSREAQRVEAVRRMLVANDVTDIEAAIAARDVDRTYTSTRDASITVYPDTVPALEELTERGFELRAASNGAMDLEALGLAKYFAATEYAPFLGISKPDPRFYATVVERAGVAPSAVLAVGDRVDNDYEPAHAAGLHALLVDRAGRLDATLPRVRALTELGALVERA